MKLREKLGRDIVKYAIVAMVILAIGGVWQAVAAPIEGPARAPSGALLAVSWNTAAIAVDTNCTAQLSQSYAYHDLFCSITISDPQTITIKMQVSPDNSTWYDAQTLVTSQTTSANVFTRCMSYGRYSRAVLNVTGGNTITPVCKSVFFNNWTPAYYVEMAP